MSVRDDRHGAGKRRSNRPGAAATIPLPPPSSRPARVLLFAAGMDWSELFGLSVSPLELFIRGSAMYLFLFIIFRVVVKRRIGSVGMADILILVIVADAAQNGMSGEYKSVTDGFILVATLVGWNMLIDFLTYRFPALQNVLEPPPLLLIDNGRVLWKHLRQELMSESELKIKLREHGVTDPREVTKAFMEPDGQMTVLKKKQP